MAALTESSELTGLALPDVGEMTGWGPNRVTLVTQFFVNAGANFDN